ncbi:hypothetical protein NEFER02_1361, partial [Nematocida sp. LUAm2]
MNITMGYHCGFGNRILMLFALFLFFSTSWTRGALPLNGVLREFIDPLKKNGIELQKSFGMYTVSPGVFLAKYKGKPCVAKIMGGSQGPNLLQPLKNEYAAMSSVSLEGVVAPIAYFEEDAFECILMEHVEGVRLDVYIRRMTSWKKNISKIIRAYPADFLAFKKKRGASNRTAHEKEKCRFYFCLDKHPHELLEECRKTLLPIRTVVDILYQVKNLILLLHEAQITHTDINLTNIILTEGMRVKLLDFGSANRQAKVSEKDWMYAVVHDRLCLGRIAYDLVSYRAAVIENDRYHNLSTVQNKNVPTRKEVIAKLQHLAANEGASCVHKNKFMGVMKRIEEKRASSKYLSISEKDAVLAAGKPGEWKYLIKPLFDIPRIPSELLDIIRLCATGNEQDFHAACQQID